MTSPSWHVHMQLAINDRNDYPMQGNLLFVPGRDGRWCLPGGPGNCETLRTALAEHVHNQTGLLFNDYLGELRPVDTFEFLDGDRLTLVLLYETTIGRGEVPYTAGKWIDVFGLHQPRVDMHPWTKVLFDGATHGHGLPQAIQLSE
ncbi:hypothetical protein [Sciscionella sediminilitoris]|uniref:hypothetical protein n=1 Tax=Sciscionella sediminilitoris TaxID=1445613 RepID=UPI0012E1B0B3|nr:hypothetical protein [Sciscionella sp. SE31]